MLLETTYENIVTKQNHLRKRKLYTYKCDNTDCLKVFQTKIKKDSLSKRHVCSRKCQRIIHKGCLVGTRFTRKDVFKYIECANQNCTNKRRVVPNRPRKYCSRACYHSHTGKTCLVSGCARKVKFNNKTGYCYRHVGIGTRKRHITELYNKLGNKCVCCGEADEIYFQIDHVYNDGFTHRKSEGGSHTGKLLEYLELNPKGLQILCCNCNQAKWKNDGKLYKPTKFTRRSAKQREVTT